MNEAKRRFFSGDSLQQALVQAANHFNLAPEEISYRSIEKKHGFIKVRRKVVIEVNPDAPRKERSAASATVLAPPPPPSRPAPVATAPVVEAPREIEAPRRAPLVEPRAERPAEHPVAPESPPRVASPERLDRPERIDRPARPVREEGQAQPPGERREPRGDGRGDRRDDRRGDRPVGRGRRDERSDRPARLDRGDRGGRGERSGAPREARDRTAQAPRPAFEPVRGREPGILEAGGLVSLPDTPRRVSERFPPAEGAQAEAARTATELLLRIAGLDLTQRVLQGEDRLEVDLAGADVDWCFADDGELVLAIEHLLPRLIRSVSGEAALVRVDCDNFQEIREERLRSLAQRMAEEVRRFGKPRTLEPMNPADRRIIHVTLADDPHVVTESEGDGFFKRVMIRPA